MKSKWIWYCLVVMLFMACKSSGKKEVKEVIETKKPNILIFFVDDLGKEWVGSYGATDIETPNIDALAKSGIQFNNVYGMPQCTPSRVTLLTGQYPFRHGWVNHWDVPRWGGGAHFDETLNPSLPLEMRKAGYKTCIAGKWQIDDFRVEPDALTKAGFDEYCMWTGYEKGVDASSHRYNDPYIFTKGGSKTYPGQYGPKIFKDFVINFIRENKDAPMFVYYPMVLTHGPWEKTPLEDAPTKLGRHKAMVNYTDMVTGEVVKVLEELGIRDNTLILWTTDNGTGGFAAHLNGRKVHGGKAKTLETGICLPFIASWPGTIPQNVKSNALIDFTDFFPTCLDMAQVKVGRQWQVGDKKHTIDGKSFKSVLLENSPTSQRDWILGMGGGNNAKLTDKSIENQYVFRDRVVRNERYKLYIDTSRKPVKFYDLEADPGEKNNIIEALNTDKQKNNYKELVAVLDYFPAKDNDPSYIPNAPQPWDVEVTAKSQDWKIGGGK